MPEVMNFDLAEFIKSHQRILVLTGAGISTASGIPDYRDTAGNWKHSQPMQLQEFRSDHRARQRYWARSVVGWEKFRRAEPNAAHYALSTLESTAKVSLIITQNVDRLHQRAGSTNVVDLHGSLDRVICLQCGAVSARDQLQAFMRQANPQLDNLRAEMAPDGDTKLDSLDFTQIKIMHCEHCQGVLKPDVVFYGENVPKSRVMRCFDSLHQSDAILVVGSSLMVYSGFRFVRRAHELGLPIVLINQGVTRADALSDLKIQQDCVKVLTEAVAGVNC